MGSILNRNFITVTGILLILIAIPLSVFLAQQQQEFRQQAQQLCAQVITPAQNSETGECREFPTPCDVPTGWQRVSSCPLPTPTPTSTLTPEQQGWHYGQPNVVFEWQYHWVRNTDGYWTIFSVGQTPIGSALLVITGDSSGQKSVNIYPGTLMAASLGLDITFQGAGVSYRGTQDGLGDHIVISSPHFSFDGAFSQSIGVLNHGTVQVAQGVVSPDYYSQSLTVNGTMTIDGQHITLQNAIAENDHQYGLVQQPGILDLSKLSPLSGQSLSIAHDWIYASLGELAIAGTRIKDKTSNSVLANHVVVQKQGESQKLANDAVFTPLEFYADNFSKKIRVSSAQLQLDMLLEIPDQSSLILGNILQEDGNANVTATYQGQSYSGFGIKESTDQTGLAATPTLSPASLLTPTPTPTVTVAPTPTPAPGALVDDINQDGNVDIFDYNTFVRFFGKRRPENLGGVDLDSDGDVDIFDYNIFVNNYTRP